MDIKPLNTMKGKKANCRMTPILIIFNKEKILCTVRIA